MVQAKRFLLRLFFTIEIMVFIFIYFFGTQGLQVVMGMRKENGMLAFQTRQLQDEVDVLKEKITTWKSDPFHKEKAAREQLHMARPYDEVYFLD